MNKIKTYSAQIIAYIKQALLNGEFKPGDKVNEVRLASALSISRAPVREALQMLVNDGLILSIPQKGKFIKALSAKDIRDSYSIGGVLEGAAIAESCELLTREDFATLESLLAQMAQLDSGAPDYAENFALLDIGFHEKLLARTENKLMVEHARTICQRMSKFLLFRYWPHAFSHSEVVERHEKVLKAVRSRSREHIERAIRAHYLELGDRMSRFGCDRPKD
jgi:DNA-binding GntR family transcriptional regulator